MSCPRCGEPGHRWSGEHPLICLDALRVALDHALVVVADAEAAGLGSARKFMATRRKATR